MALLTNFWLFDLITVFVLLLSAVYLYYKHKFSYWRKKNVLSLQPKLVLGDFSEINRVRSFGEIVEQQYWMGKDQPFVGLYFFQHPTLLVRDLNLIKDVMIKDFDSFHDRGLPIDEDVDPLLGHLFNLSGKKWRNLRVKLSPTFTSGKMKMMFPTLVENGENLKKYLHKTAVNNETIEMKEVLARFTTDIISSCAFGIDSNCLNNPDSEFRKMGKKVFEPKWDEILANILGVISPQLVSYLKLHRMTPELTNFFLNTFKETTEYRENNNIHRNDFMQLLIQLIKKGKIDDPDALKEKGDLQEAAVEDDQTFDIKKAAAQAFVFFSAGFETSSTAMQFALYELALNHEIQERLQQAIDEVLSKHDEQLTYEGLQEMEYLDRVISESLRKYPPIPVHFRECTKDYKFRGQDLVLEKGTGVFISVLGIQRDPKYFPEPDKFDPERFTPEEKARRHHLAYTPFGEGPRICIGERFGMMQTKVGLISILSKYTVNISRETIVPMEFDPLSFVPTPKRGMSLKLSLRVL